MAVKVLAGSVVAHGGSRVSVASRKFLVAEGDVGVGVGPHDERGQVLERCQVVRDVGEKPAAGDDGARKDGAGLATLWRRQGRALFRHA
jgi:hypothetical protein